MVLETAIHKVKCSLQSDNKLDFLKNPINSQRITEMCPKSNVVCTDQIITVKLDCF